MNDDEPRYGDTSLERARRATAIEGLFLAFVSGVSEQRVRLYLRQTEHVTVVELECAVQKLIDTWERSSVPPIAILKRTAAEYGRRQREIDHGYNGERRPLMSPEAAREHVLQKIKAIGRSGQRMFCRETGLWDGDQHVLDLEGLVASIWEEYREHDRLPLYEPPR